MSDWQQAGACAGDGQPDDWFPPPGSTRPPYSVGKARAVAICGACIVQEACLDYALAEAIPYGVWAGLDEVDRADLGQAMDGPGYRGDPVSEDRARRRQSQSEWRASLGRRGHELATG